MIDCEEEVQSRSRKQVDRIRQRARKMRARVRYGQRELKRISRTAARSEERESSEGDGTNLVGSATKDGMHSIVPLGLAMPLMLKLGVLLTIGAVFCGLVPSLLAAAL